ncbi:MAG TPA: DEAD/DEAH box helicase family protein, partial [Methanosarcina thermophila]|nr:DEAD/DEAH box helicase family protein [Methanosarcina thermophila]
MTGINHQLQPHLEQAIQKAERIRLIVAFVMESGVKLLVPHLKLASERGVPIQLLTSRYLSITEPSAIYYLYDHVKDIDIRFYSETVRSFHPKAYIFDYGDEGEIFVGSSNISLSALTTGVEWNYRFFKSEHPEDYQHFSDTFDLLFQYYSEPVTEELLKEYALSYKKPRIMRSEEISSPPQLPTPEPRGAQIEALYYLKQARLEGVNKGLVVAATGIGKTHLAAFDSLAFERVLFIAHRDEIVRQAYDIFRSIRPASRLGFYTGEHKDSGADIYFSTIQTLSRPENLRVFPPDYFDYIVVDEFHHAAAESYRRVLDYFQSDFLLGLTATPFRMDNKDIFELCGDNVIYEISLKQAIERDILVPFRYYAIYDPTDYDKVEFVNGRYVIEDLERELSHTDRADLILTHYQRLAGERTLGFCVSIKHAEFMAQYFTEHGIKSVAVHSGLPGNNGSAGRHEAVEMLKNGNIQVIFAVDIFNEGVDIPVVDTVMFLRPTESYVVFLQQLGRGLRKHQDKHYLTVIDFIGNYKRAHYVPLILAGENPWTSQKPVVRNPEEYNMPEGCMINFDFRIIDLFQELATHDPKPIRMRDTYSRLKQALKRRPTRVDIYEGSDMPIREYLKDGWLRFLKQMGDLDPTEESWLGTAAEEFLKEIEKTHMTKAYKVPTITTFLIGGTIVPRVHLDQIAEKIRSFYFDNPLHQKDLNDSSNRNWRNWGLKEIASHARKNPVNFLSRGRFFHYDEINKVMYIDSSVEPFL